MGVYKETREAAQLMKVFGVPDADIIDTFMKLSPDPYHSVGFVSLITGVEYDRVKDVFRNDDRFIRVDGFVWTTQDKLENCTEVDNFEKLV